MNKIKMNNFEKNISIWAKERPIEAFHLQNVSTNGYKLISSSNGHNLETPKGLLYSNPIIESESWKKSLNLEGIKALYVYGVGLGYYYFPLKKWLKEDADRHIIFFEDNPAIIRKLFELEHATEILEDNQVSLCYVSSPKDEDGVLETLYWSNVLSTYFVSALNFYALHKAEKFSEFKYKISYDATMKNALVEEYLLYGVAFFKNFYPNMLHLHNSFWGNALFDKFKNVPAIICGAGPSLEKQIALLKDLKNKALIFAGGSALNALQSFQFLPHLSAGIDPNITFDSRLKKSQEIEIPFFYRPRMLAEAFKKIKGPRLYISGAGGYDISEYYEEKFNLKSDFLDEGHNVVNFCTEIATRMGCNPIIFIGMDLAFTNLKSYSAGIEEDTQIDEEKILNHPQEDQRGIKKIDIYGKPIISLWKWIAESDWLTEYAKNHPETRYINATEGGIGFKDISNVSFKEIIQEVLTKDIHLEERLKEEILKSKLSHVTEEKVKSLTLELRQSLERCIEAIQILQNEIQDKFSKDLSHENLSGRAALAESDLFEEPAYKYILDIFHQVFARVQNKKVVQLRLNKNTMSETDQVVCRLNLQLDKLHFLKCTAEANIALIDYALKLP